MKTLVWPVATYGCKMWPQRADDIAWLQAFEMLYYRKIIQWAVLGELEVERIFLGLVSQRKQILWPCSTCTDSLHPWRIQGIIDGACSRGQPRRIWTDDIRDWTGRTLVNCTQRVRDKPRWRWLVHEQHSFTMTHCNIEYNNTNFQPLYSHIKKTYKVFVGFFDLTFVHHFGWISSVPQGMTYAARNGKHTLKYL